LGDCPVSCLVAGLWELDRFALMCGGMSGLTFWGLLGVLFGDGGGECVLLLYFGQCSKIVVQIFGIGQSSIVYLWCY